MQPGHEVLFAPLTVRGHTLRNRIVWLALFVPVRGESVRLGFAKMWCVLQFVGLGAFLVSQLSACRESVFLGRIALCYAITALLAAAVARLLRTVGYLGPRGETGA